MKIQLGALALDGDVGPNYPVTPCDGSGTVPVHQASCFRTLGQGTDVTNMEWAVANDADWLNAPPAQSTIAKQTLEQAQQAQCSLPATPFWTDLVKAVDAGKATVSFYSGLTANRGWARDVSVVANVFIADYQNGKHLSFCSVWPVGFVNSPLWTCQCTGVKAT